MGVKSAWLPKGKKRPLLGQRKKNLLSPREVYRPISLADRIPFKILIVINAFLQHTVCPKAPVTLKQSYKSTMIKT